MQLEIFFGVVRRFNGNIHIDAKIRNEIEGFFEYSWNANPTQALDNKTDRAIFEQLPHSVQQRIFTDYLFDVFLEDFKFLFLIEKQPG